jgi:hypothetical protein
MSTFFVKVGSRHFGDRHCNIHTYVCSSKKLIERHEVPEALRRCGERLEHVADGARDKDQDHSGGRPSRHFEAETWMPFKEDILWSKCKKYVQNGNFCIHSANLEPDK